MPEKYYFPKRMFFESSECAKKLRQINYSALNALSEFFTFNNTINGHFTDKNNLFLEEKKQTEKLDIVSFVCKQRTI